MNTQSSVNPPPVTKHPDGSKIKKTRAIDVPDTHIMDLTVKKLPTDTLQMRSKKTKYHDQSIYPNSCGPSRVIFSGPSGSGKTNFCLSLLTDSHHMAGHFDKIYVFCPSSDLQVDYDHLKSRFKVPEEMEIVDFGAAAVQVAWDHAREVIRLCKEAKPPAPEPQTLFLFDDCINVPGFDRCASTLCTKARHSGISVWVLTQSLMNLSRLMRLQASNIFAFSPTESEVERLSMECTNPVSGEKLTNAIVKAATAERYQPFHVNRHAPVHLQYRKGLTTFYKLHDPSIHGSDGKLCKEDVDSIICNKGDAKKKTKKK